MKPSNNKKEEGPLNFSQRLKKIREDSGLTLKKFAEISKIQTKYLEYLEEGRFEKLPAFVYVQGFLKKYSQIFNLPFGELISQYQAETGTDTSAKNLQILNLPSLPEQRAIITPKKLKWAAIIIVVLAILGYLVYQLDFLIAPPKLILQYPSQDLTINSSSINIYGQADYSSRLTINGQQIFVESDGSFSQEMNLSPGMNTLKIEATNYFGKTNELIRYINVQLK
jgi:cytoskeletal protein RodZ